MIFMPFSPRWLVHHDREPEARKILARLRELPEDNELIELEFAEIKAQSLFEKKTLRENFPHLQDMSAWSTFKLQFVAIGSLFTTKAMFKRVVVATVTMFFQQWTGINAVLYYAPTIFGKLGLSSNSVSLLATGVVGIVMFIATIPAVMYVDSWGRRPTLVIGAIGMAACHIIIVSFRDALVTELEAYRPRPSLQQRTSTTGNTTSLLDGLPSSWFGCSSSISDTHGDPVPGLSSLKSGPFPTVHMVLPLALRPTGKLPSPRRASRSSSVLMPLRRMNNFIVGQVTPDMLKKMTYGTYIFFGLLTFLGAGFIFFVCPETKGLSLEEMDILFGSVGVAAREKERWDEVHNEVGLTELLARLGVRETPSGDIVEEKPVVHEKTTVAPEVKTETA